MSLLQNTMAKSGGDFYNGITASSLRANHGDSPGIKRTGVTGTSRRIFTYSSWVKRTGATQTQTESLLQVNQGNDSLMFGFRDEGDSDGPNIQLLHYNGSSYDFRIETSAKLRDVSSWYHIVGRIDTTQGTAANRVRIYINGVLQTALAQTTYPSENFDTTVNVADTIYYMAGGAAANAGGGNVYFDSYITEINYIDGLSLGPGSFGEFKNGVWIPKDTSGLTFGNNGTRLQFLNSGTGTTSQGTTATTNIGDDSSGNGHNFAVLNYVASDIVPDNPENNFAKMNPLDPGGAITYSEGDLKMIVSGGSMEGSRATMALPQSGKWYWEVGVVALGYISQVGIATSQKLLANTADGEPDHIAWGFGTWMTDNNSGVSKYQVNVGGSGGVDWVAIPSSGDVLGIAYDADNGKLWFAKNGTYQNTSGTANPATGVDPRASSLTGKEWFPLFAGYPEGSPNYIMNFGQDSSFAGNETAQGNTDGEGIGDFYYAPPSGYLTLCTANLPEPTIGPNSTTQADDYFGASIYEGNGSTQNIAVNFKPDWTWIKNRDATDEHQLFDSSRGVTKVLESSTTAAEATNDDTLTAFISTGFSLGDDVAVNTNNESYVSWNWKANGGTTVTNEAGSIDSTVQANTTAGFSIVLYTGSESNATVGHGLGGVPDMLIWKKRNGVNDWIVYHSGNTSAPATDHLHLNNTNATNDQAVMFQDTLPTSTVFSIGTDDDVNDAKNYVVYCFRSIEGYSRIGTYEGTDTAPPGGAFVYLGFRPKYILIKNVDHGFEWLVYDTTRTTINVTSDWSRPNTNEVDYAATTDAIDVLSNGFKIRSDWTRVNYQSIIYMAFAEQPFKYSNAR